MQRHNGKCKKCGRFHTALLQRTDNIRTSTGWHYAYRTDTGETLTSEGIVHPGPAVTCDCGHRVPLSRIKGWKSSFSDAEFAPLWELGKRARQQHAKGERLLGEDSRTYLMSIGCGDFYQWHVLVTENFAEQSGEDTAAELARKLFGLARNPPMGAIR